MKKDKPNGLFFEEFAVKDTFYSDKRLITEEDVQDFANLSEDHNRIHTDEEYAKASIFGERIAHGLLGLSIVSGLAARLGFSHDTVIALRSIDWKFKLPIKLGDEIRGIFTVSDKRELPKEKSGLVIFDVKVINQKDQIVQTGRWVMIIKRSSYVGEK
jgi:acyl dehydratase